MDTMIRPVRTAWLSPARWLVAFLAIVVLAGILSAIAFRAVTLANLLPFLWVLLAGVGLLWLGWRLLRAERPPTWLAALLAVSALLRLAAGVLWFTTLPALGHGTPAELGGYVMSDAHKRDMAAWDLARSDQPLSRAFFDYPAADQYGGLLFLSALVYRYLGGAVHAPLQMVVLSAAASALAVLFAWALSRRLWGPFAGAVAAWGLAIYPEAVLLGSSQMREAYLVTLTGAAFYGLLLFLRNDPRRGLAWMLGALLLYLPFSPPFAAGLLLLLALAALLSGELNLTMPFRDRRLLWLVAAVLVVLVLAGAWLALQRLAPGGASNPLAALSWWLRKSAEYQVYLNRQASGWIQKIFRSTPEWMHVPIMLGYGVVRPFLPAALTAPSESPIWPLISLWRSLGWTALLAFLVYAPLRLVSKNDASRLTKALILVVWIVILVASFRGGGDQDDNPRYRAIYACLQVALAAWVWSAQRRSSDPWLRRLFVGLALVLLPFLPWYLRRFTGLPWPSDLFKNLALGASLMALFIIWDWARLAGSQPHHPSS